MKILYVTNTTHSGGSTVALVNIIKGMSNYGHSIYVLANEDGGELYDLLKDLNIKIFSCPYCLTVYPLDKNPLKYIYGFFLHLVWWYKARKTIGRIIDKYNIDIVHTNVGPLDLALDKCKKKGIVHVWHQRELFDKFSSVSLFPNNNYFYERIKSTNNYNICITKQVLENCKLTESFKNRVIYDGVFRKAELSSHIDFVKEKYFLYVGRVEPNKGLYDLLQAFYEFHKRYPDYRLKIAGHFESSNLYYVKCCDVIRNYNLESNVDFLGNRRDIYNLMSRATAHVVSSHFEGFGFTVVEAMINKTLVIGRNTSGIKEQFDLGLEATGHEIGLRFHDNHSLIQSLYDAVEKDNSLMIFDAYNVASDLYTIETCVASINKLYLDSQKTTI